MRYTLKELQVQLHNNERAISNLILRYGPDHKDVQYYKEYNNILKQITARVHIMEKQK